jgi:hypothetical protein
MNPRQILHIALLAIPSVVCADQPPRLSVDTSLYPYLDRVETDSDLTLTINAPLPARFSYFGFINNRGVVSDGHASFIRSEQNLRWRISDDLPLDLNVQAIIVDGPGNDVTQVAVAWRVHDTPAFKAFFDRINMIYRLGFYLKRFSSGDDKAWQMEHFFKMRFPGISDRLYLSGFVDQTFDLGLAEELPESPIVTEIQGGARIWDNFYVIAEYRINQFRLGKEHNLAVGIEYKYAWR